MRIINISLVVILAATLTACASPAQTPPPQPTPVTSANLQAVTSDGITGIDWRWEQLDETLSTTQTLVLDKEKYSLIFQTDGTYAVSADCNTASGKFAIEGSAIIMLPGLMSLENCAEGSLSSNFLNLLGDVTTIGLKDGQLTLVTSDGNTSLSFYNSGNPVEASLAQSPDAFMDPKSVTLNTFGLPLTAFPSLMDATPYDPTLPAGLPEHIEVIFSTDSLANAVPNAPVIYIIPRGAYEKLWELNGDASVTGNLVKLESLLQEKAGFPAFGMPVLPFEQAAGVNILVAQGAYLSTPTLNGLRFIGQFTQNDTKSGLIYIYEGLTLDGQYLVSFFYPLANADPKAPQPDLATLDLVIPSLAFGTTP